MIHRVGSRHDRWTTPGLVVLQYLATLAMVAFFCAIAAIDGRGWQWPLFIWGIAAAAVALALSRRLVVTFGRMLRATPQQLEGVSVRQAARRRFVEPPIMAFGLAASVLSARGWWGADLAFTVAVVLCFLILPRLVFMLLRRRLDAGQNAD